MSDDEISTNNSMDVDFGRNESSSSPSVPTTTGVVLDLGIGTGYISGSDDDDDQNSQERRETIPSKTSTPDSTTLSSTITRKPTTTATTKKTTLTKTKSALVNYDRDSDDDEHTEDEDEMEENNEEPDAEDNDSNSNHGNTASASGERDSGQNEENPLNEQTIGTSDLLNVTPLRNDDSASPLSHGDMTASQQFLFPEDAEIRIPPQPSKSCPPKLEKKFEEYYQRLKRTGFNQNALIQGMKDFRNPCMYEKIISHLGIDEIGTNFPQDLYDPHWWGKESYYEELSKAQKLEIERREQERRERNKIAFVPGVRKVDQLGVLPTSSNEPVVEKRKNRFDQ